MKDTERSTLLYVNEAVELFANWMIRGRGSSLRDSLKLQERTTSEPEERIGLTRPYILAVKWRC
jgi:hypothetical protein